MQDRCPGVRVVDGRGTSELPGGSALAALGGIGAQVWRPGPVAAWSSAPSITLSGFTTRSQTLHKVISDSSVDNPELVVLRTRRVGTARYWPTLPIRGFVGHVKHGPGRAERCSRAPVPLSAGGRSTGAYSLSDGRSDKWICLENVVVEESLWGSVPDVRAEAGDHAKQEVPGIARLVGR